MTTKFIALALLFASTPAAASINLTDDVPIAIAPQPASFDTQPVVTSEPVCGEPREMIFILRDPSGAIVAMGVEDAVPSC